MHISVGLASWVASGIDVSCEISLVIIARLSALFLKKQKYHYSTLR